MKYSEGQLVQVTMYGSKKPAPDPENLWEIAEIVGNDCTIRNIYDDYRAKQDGLRVTTQRWHTSMLKPWKLARPIGM